MSEKFWIPSKPEALKVFWVPITASSSFEGPMNEAVERLDRHINVLHALERTETFRMFRHHQHRRDS